MELKDQKITMVVSIDELKALYVAVGNIAKVDCGSDDIHDTIENLYAEFGKILDMPDSP